jgi:hypothetical protein
VWLDALDSGTGPAARSGNARKWELNTIVQPRGIVATDCDGRHPRADCIAPAVCAPDGRGAARWWALLVRP